MADPLRNKARRIVDWAGLGPWLGDLDSNQDQRSQSPPFYR